MCLAKLYQSLTYVLGRFSANRGSNEFANQK